MQDVPVVDSQWQRRSVPPASAGGPSFQKRKAIWLAERTAIGGQMHQIVIDSAVHGGVDHDLMHLPAYGGTFCEPDRFPFLEGRPTGTSWRDAPSLPLAIHNRNVLHLLEALQVLQVRV